MFSVFIAASLEFTFYWARSAYIIHQLGETSHVICQVVQPQVLGVECLAVKAGQLDEATKKQKQNVPGHVIFNNAIISFL